MQLLLHGFIFRIIFTGTGFLISLLIAKLAGPGQFGSLSLIIVNAAFIHIITGLGTDAAIVWHGIAGENYNRNKIFSFTIITAAIQLLFFYIIAILGFILLGHTLLGGTESLKIFVAEIVYFTGLVLVDKFASLYYSQHEAKLCNKILAVVSGILIIIVILLWITDPLLIAESPVWIYSLFIFIPSIILFLSFLVKFKPSVAKISDAELRSFSAFSGIVLVTNIIQFIAFRADYWIISVFHGHDALGVYAQASKFAQLLWIIPGILAGLVIPALKNKGQKLTDRQLISITRVTLFMHVIISLLLIIIALIIYYFFLPNVYFNGFYSLLIMLPGYLLFTITTLLAAWFSAHRLLKINLYGSILCCVLMIIFDLVLIPLLNYKGAAIANLCVYTIATAYFILRAVPLMNIPVKDYFVFKKSDFDLFSGEVLKTENQNT